MSLDKICFCVRNEKQVYNNKISLKNLVKKKFSYSYNSEELFVFLPPWGEKLYLNAFLRQELLDDKFSVLEFEFPVEILSANWRFTLNNFKLIQKIVKKEISLLKQEFGFQKITVVGTSIGCVNACMITNNNSDVNALILVVPGHDLAESMWKGISTQKLRKSFENKNISLKQLKNYWKSLSPQNNIDKLKGKQIKVFLSKADKVIPYYCGVKLVNKLRSLNYNLNYNENEHLGHYFTTMSFYLKPKKYLFGK